MPHATDCPCPACQYRRRGQEKESPRLVVRLDPSTREWVLHRPEGARAWIETRARQEMGNVKTD